MSFQIVVEADNVARRILTHEGDSALTYTAPGVSLLSESYCDEVQAAHSLADNTHAVLAYLAIGDALNDDE